MDDQKRAINWYLSNASLLQLKVKAYNWPLDFDSGVKDCLSEITIKGRCFEGRGSGTTEEEAFLKSMGEALDRYLFFTYQNIEKTTSGFSTHLSRDLAINSARFEIIERDKFFCHYLTSTPFYKTRIKLENLEIDNRIFDFLLCQKVEFSLLEMRKSKEVSSFIFYASGLSCSNKFGLTFGLGCNRDPQKAAMAATWEGLRHVVWVLSQNSIDSISSHDFNPDDKDLVKHHALLGLSPCYFEQISDIFRLPLVEEKNYAEQSVKLENIHYKILNWPVTLEDCPIVGVHASSEDLQKLFFGRTVEEVVNIDRLKQFTGKNITWEAIQKTPHPMG